MAASGITLHSSRPSTEIHPRDVYFAFASGRMGYDCITCQAKCCRGFGYDLETFVQLERQVGLRPALGLFIDRRRSGSQSAPKVANMPPSCFFLDDDHKCQVHADLGYDAKPETCRLFPFNGIYRVGTYLMVRAHDNLCPLAVLPGGSKSDCSDYYLLTKSMAAQGIHKPPEELRSTLKPASLAIALEREIVRLSDEHIGDADYLPFALAQATVTRHALDEARRAVSEVDKLDDLIRFRTTLLHVLGIDANDKCLSDPVAARTMIGTTPHWRSRIVFQSAQAETAGSIGLERIPKLLVAIHVVVALARQAGMRDATFQTTSRLVNQHAQLLYLLSHVDCEMRWRPNAKIALGFDGPPAARSTFVTIVRELLRSSSRTGVQRQLGAILSDNLPESGAKRLMFLRDIAHRLGGSICPINNAPQRRLRSYREIRSAIRHAILPRLSHEMLSALSFRESKEKETSVGNEDAARLATVSSSDAVP